MYNFQAKVAEVRYKFNVDGCIIPVLLLDRQDGSMPYQCELYTPPNSSTISIGDIVQINENHKDLVSPNEIILIERTNDPTAITFPMYLVVCPYCQEILIRVNVTDHFGRCYSKSCPAQISSNIDKFVTYLGMYFTGIYRNIYMHLLTRNIFKDIADIFNLRQEQIFELDNVYIKNSDISAFINHVNSFKEKLNLGTILTGLVIPGLNIEEIDIITKIFNNDTSIFKSWIYNNNIAVLPNTIKTKLSLFFYIPSNINTFSKLCGVMYPTP